ncbi:uncharacterized protein CEXT_802841 [Caerostris extrusa]|uniref:Uncharacterized protein n=1 Tax=Caerostris extrusa TaxID=172846 RepID=A0AAV4M759_CAEEX|nr:uncharacterized protein CEXT_802841 [Caerostris extrusa]
MSPSQQPDAFSLSGIDQVSCYTLLSGFRLPWPPSCCLEQPTPFMGSHERLASDALTRRLVHPTAPVLLTKSGPLGTLIQSSGLQSCKADFSPI